MLGDAIDCFCKIYRRPSARDIDTEKKQGTQKSKGNQRVKFVAKGKQRQNFFFHIKNITFFEMKNIRFSSILIKVMCWVRCRKKNVFELLTFSTFCTCKAVYFKSFCSPFIYIYYISSYANHLICDFPQVYRVFDHSHHNIISSR